MAYLSGNEGAGERDGGPGEDAEGHDQLAVVAVAEVAKDRGEDHVAADEDGLQEAGLRPADAVVTLDVTQYACGQSNKSFSTEKRSG